MFRNSLVNQLIQQNSCSIPSKCYKTITKFPAFFAHNTQNFFLSARLDFGESLFHIYTHLSPSESLWSTQVQWCHNESSFNKLFVDKNSELESKFWPFQVRSELVGASWCNAASTRVGKTTSSASSWTGKVALLHFLAAPSPPTRPVETQIWVLQRHACSLEDAESLSGKCGRFPVDVDEAGWVKSKAVKVTEANTRNTCVAVNTGEVISWNSFRWWRFECLGVVEY